MEDKLKELLSNCYALYSNYKVSAILETKNGDFFSGVNVENASFGATICAERSAIVNAISSGIKKQNFKALYIMNSSEKIATPCFICRQFFVEMFDKDCEIFCYNINGEYNVYKVSDLCPYPFDEENLK